MFELKYTLVFNLAVLCLFDQNNGLVTLPKVEENDIIKTESFIRTSVNSLFSILGLKKVRDKPRLKQYSHIHNYFISLTLQDYNSLKEIAKLTRVNKNNLNDSTDFINLLNEILGEENYLKLQSIVMGENLRTEYDVEGEIDKIEYLKNIQTDQNVLKNMDLNKEVLKILLQEGSLDLNVSTAKPLTVKEDDDKLLDDLPTWQEEEHPLSGRRLFNAERTKIKKFPFMASVQIFNKFQCGGSIIKSDLVITAASCLQLAWNNRFYRENPAFLSVRVGSSFYEVGGEIIAVLEVYFHPSYDPKNLHNNLALMRLVRKIRLKRKRAKKILLDDSDNPLPINIRSGVETLGWGARTASNQLHGPFEDKLRHTVLSVYPIQDCQDVYSKEYVTQKNFCAGSVSVGSGACNRDVGGPGIVYGKLTGVISFGAPHCGTPDAPTVFTKIGFYSDWIEDIMAQDVPTKYKRTTLPPPKYPYQPPGHHTHKNPWLIPPISTPHGYDIIAPTKPTLPPGLRQEDKKMFKEFLKTMFSSAEVNEYLDSASENPTNSVTEAFKKPILEQQPTVQQEMQLSAILEQQPNLHQPAVQFPDSQLPIMEHSDILKPVVSHVESQQPQIKLPGREQLIIEQAEMLLTQLPDVQQLIKQLPVSEPTVIKPLQSQHSNILSDVQNTQPPDHIPSEPPRVTAMIEELPFFGGDENTSSESSEERMNTTIIIPLYPNNPAQILENKGTTALSMDLVMDGDTNTDQEEQSEEVVQSEEVKQPEEIVQLEEVEQLKKAKQRKKIKRQKKVKEDMVKETDMAKLLDEVIQSYEFNVPNEDKQLDNAKQADKVKKLVYPDKEPTKKNRYRLTTDPPVYTKLLSDRIINKQKYHNQKHNKIDDAILALLYVSDSEKDEIKQQKHLIPDILDSKRDSKDIKMSKPPPMTAPSTMTEPTQMKEPTPMTKTTSMSEPTAMTETTPMSEPTSTTQMDYRLRNNEATNIPASYSYPQNWHRGDDLDLRKLMTNDYLIEFLNHELTNHIKSRRWKLGELPIEVAKAVHVSPIGMDWKRNSK